MSEFYFESSKSDFEPQTNLRYTCETLGHRWPDMGELGVDSSADLM